MSSQVASPGKTAPKLAHDLYLFDPVRVKSAYNVLADPPPIWEDGKQSALPLHNDRCKHEYVTLPNQSQLPELDERPHKGTVWKVATVCKKCRIHANVTLDFRKAGHSICPNAHEPLHFFKIRGTQTTAEHLHCDFACTSWGCQAALTVTYALPVLDSDTFTLITNEDNLNRRYRAIMEQEPGRKDVILTTPEQALYRLKRYIDDSLKPTHDKRQFPAHNKKFLGAFGPECHDFLKKLGFRYEEAGAGGHTWHLPDPGLTISPLSPDVHRVLLEYWSVELQILLDQICLREGIPNPSPREAWRDARKDIERSLSAQDYDRLPGRVLSPSEEDHPCFGALGALGDFSDSLIEFAYNRQTSTDPLNTPYYFDCLQQLAQGRQSEKLLVKISSAVSEGVVGRMELIEAYKDLGATGDLNTARDLDDTYLIDLYRAIVTDSGTDRRKRLRQSLQKIGQSRRSKAIMNVASDAVETYEEALAYLGAEQSMGDEIITVLYGSKIGDSAENTQMAQRAVQIIAEKRDSAALRGFLSTGELSTFEMDLDEACQHLKIKFSPDMDEETLNLTLGLASEDSPGQRTEQAIAAVRKALAERQKFSNHASETWPVGLESHGNTCYLNSLLQYYFTIKPLRDLVLDIENHKFDLDTNDTKSQRVQSIRLKRYEIEAYQKFADHLKSLFQRMIEASGPRVRPDTELVCGAFLTPNESKAVEETGQVNAPAESIDADMSGIDSENREGIAHDATLDSATMPSKTVSRKTSNASSVTLIEEESAPIPETHMITPPASPKTDPPEPQKRPPLPPRPTADKPKTQLELAEDAAKRQQDVAEVMEDLLRRLRAAIKPQGQDSQGEQLDQLRDLFNMRFTETIVADGKYKTKEEEDATNILLNVPFEPTGIYSALDRVLDLRKDDIAGKPAELYRAFTSLPLLLQISVPRIALQNGQAVKVNHSLRLEETIFMDRYCNKPSVLSRRQECWRLKQKLQSMQAQRELVNKTGGVNDLNGGDLLKYMSQFLQSIPEINAGLKEVGVEPFDEPQGLAPQLELDAMKLDEYIKSLDGEIGQSQKDLEGQFTSFNQEKYRLYAVFFHRGGAGGGHYWSNIFDFKNNVWRTYNDETVELHRNPDDILNAHEWHHGTPTYAVYVRDDVKDDIVDPVCRNPQDDATRRLTLEEGVETDVAEVEAASTAANVQTDVQMAENEASWGGSVTLEDGSQGVQGNWDSNAGSRYGSNTPQKRFSDSPNPSEEGSTTKRPAIRVNDADARTPELAGGLAFEHELLTPDLQQHSTQSHERDGDDTARHTV